ncbi:hypothetical protein Ndes2526B_g00538 [Nannochloris sp. 'desiccata']
MVGVFTAPVDPGQIAVSRHSWLLSFREPLCGHLEFLHTNSPRSDALLNSTRLSIEAYISETSLDLFSTLLRDFCCYRPPLKALQFHYQVLSRHLAPPIALGTFEPR